MMVHPLRRLVFALAVVLAGAAPAAALRPGAPLLPQATELGSQTLGRPYWHVFLAYAIAVLLIGGWVVSIARRLLAIERRLKEDGGE
jgi:CcmD family protein